MLRDMGSISTDYPFDPDASALHHIIDWGWMWVLRFDNGVTSAGFSLQNHQYPLDTSISVEDEWAALLSTYPTIGEIFQGSRAVRELTRTGPMQRRLTRSAGRLEGATGTSPLAGGWAILPQGAAFVDPWLSPGISQSLICVARLARILGQSDGSILVDGLDDYERRMFAEADVVDDITSACMACFDQFQAMTAVSMLYFVAAIYVEESLRGRVASVTPVDGETLDRLGFLLAHENGYRKIVRKVCSQARNGDSAERIINTVGALLGDYDLVDLCDPARPNMHPYREFAGRPS
jgi:FADH2 O2-dependent halogenase